MTSKLKSKTGKGKMFDKRTTKAKRKLENIKKEYENEEAQHAKIFELTKKIEQKLDENGYFLFLVDQDSFKVKKKSVEKEFLEMLQKDMTRIKIKPIQELYVGRKKKGVVYMALVKEPIKVKMDPKLGTITVPKKKKIKKEKKKIVV